MTAKTLYSRIARTTGRPLAEIQFISRQLESEIEEQLLAGNPVRLGFGILEVHCVRACEICAIGTGERVRIEPRLVVRFRASERLKRRLRSPR